MLTRTAASEGLAGERTGQGQGLRWYADRLRRMTLSEVAFRAVGQGRSLAWAARVQRGATRRPPPLASVGPGGPAPLPDAVALPDSARVALVSSARQILRGQWETLGVPRPDIASPDWFFDHVTGRRAPSDLLALRVNHRDEQVTGNVKQIWELSRLHHLTVLAAAYRITGEEAFAKRSAEQLRSWWRENPVLMGIHWTSGIEVGIRLISWAWIRRLLSLWPGVSDLFEGDEAARLQIYWHQRYLAAFRSRGSAANNHVIAEAAGQLVAGLAFPWFPDSARWASDAAALLEQQLAANTFDSGINRELATDYHAFSAELALTAAAEADAAGRPLSESTHQRLCQIADAAAALVDRSGRPPRQGDGDDGRALVLDAPTRDAWSVVLAIAARCYGAQPWWPNVAPSVGAALVGALMRPRRMPSRPSRRPDHFADAGLTLLRSRVDDPVELWCRCDGGPHGFSGIAAHAHADALSIEVRVDGVDVLADPGTYCYHGEPAWRSYFRATRAHNTVQLAGTNQSVDSGPFLWTEHADTVQHRVELDGPAAVWSAEHTGYLRLDPPATHRRTVHLDRDRLVLTVLDEVNGLGEHDVGLSFHLGPEVGVRLRDARAELSWPSGDGPRTAVLNLPAELHWSAARGQLNPILGWYSPRFGHRVPTTTLRGVGISRPEMLLRSQLEIESRTRSPARTNMHSAR